MVTIEETEMGEVKEMTQPEKRTRINGSTDNSTKWIPSTLIKPVQKIVESFIHQIFGAAKVKVGIKLRVRNKKNC